MSALEGFESDRFEEGDFYWDERGFRVFTEQYLLKRGYCCKNGCRHCPYKFKQQEKQEQKND